MAKKQNKPAVEYVPHAGPSTHEELEANGVKDVLQRDMLILVEAILDVYSTVTGDTGPLRSDSNPVKAATAFVYELSQVRDSIAFLSQLDGLAVIMRGERAYRDVCGVAIRMLKDKGVTQDDFDKFVRKHCKEVK